MEIQRMTAGPYDGSLLALGALIGRPRDEVQDDIRLRCQSIYLGGGKAVARALGRYMMFLDTDDVGFATHILMNGTWEMWLTEFMVETLQPGWTVLDVGANYGYYSLLMSDLVGYSGKCIAFEPNPIVAKSLQQSLSVNGFSGNSEVRGVALSGSSGISYFYLPHKEPKNARLVTEIDQAAIDHDLGRFISVETAPLDDVVRERIDFIKIDAEGAEGAIIGGMWNVIQAHRPKMVIEYNIGRMNDAGAPLEALRSAYGEIRHLEMDGKVYDVSIDRVLTERAGEDWLLVLGK